MVVPLWGFLLTCYNFRSNPGGTVNETKELAHRGHLWRANFQLEQSVLGERSEKVNNVIRSRWGSFCDI